MTLALIGSVVDGDDHSLGAAPGKNQEAIVSPVAVPAGRAFEQLPLAIAHGRLPQDVVKPVVELPQLLVRGFVWSSGQMWRNPFLSPLELPLMEETQPR